MTKRGLQLLEAHLRSFDPDAPTARERLEAALGEPLARQLLLALCPDSATQRAKYIAKRANRCG